MDVKTIPCEPLQSILEWEGKLRVGYFSPQIGGIMHLLQYLRTLSCKLSNNYIATFWQAIYFFVVRIGVAPKNI